MSDAPKRIWAWCYADPWGNELRWFEWEDYTPEPGDSPYILATPEALPEAPEVQALIRQAVEAERATMRQWCSKRVGVVQRAWKRAAEKALRGDFGDLRNRVDMMDEPPLEIAQSAAAIRAGKE